MGRVLDLADVLRAALEPHGFHVYETNSWRERGAADLVPWGQMFHHTVSAPGRNAPSLGVVTNGRPDLAGPLCNVLWARNGDAYIIASGRANHAGAGEWLGQEFSGNRHTIGHEVENNGVDEPWPDRQLLAVELGMEAVNAAYGLDPAWTMGHKEYARPKGRKIDPSRIDMAEWRHRITTPNGTPTQEDDPLAGFTFDQLVSAAAQGAAAALRGEGVSGAQDARFNVSLRNLPREAVDIYQFGDQRWLNVYVIDGGKRVVQHVWPIGADGNLGEHELVELYDQAQVAADLKVSLRDDMWPQVIPELGGFAKGDVHVACKTTAGDVLLLSYDFGVGWSVQLRKS